MKPESTLQNILNFTKIEHTAFSLPLIFTGAWLGAGNRFPSIMMMLLMIVCGNVGLLILARTATRTGEIAIRTALGASRGRIVTQLFIEALVLAVVSTGLGLVASEVTARWLMSTNGPFELLPYWMDLTLGPRIVGVALAGRSKALERLPVARRNDDGCRPLSRKGGLALRVES